MTSQVVLALFSLASAWAFANLLSQELFGNYRLVLSIIGIAALTTLPGMSTAVTRAASRGFGGTIVPAIRKKMFFGLAGMIGAMGVAAYYWSQGNLLLATGIGIGALFVPIKDVYALFDSLLQAAKRFDLSSYYRIGTQLVSITSIIIALFCTNRLAIILLAYFLPLTIMQYVSYRATIRTLAPTQEVDHDALTYGNHLSIMSILSGFAGNFQNIMLFHILGASSLAIFYFAIAPIEQMRSVTAQVEPILFPKIAKDQWKVGSMSSFFAKTAPFILLVLGGALLYIGFAPFLFSIFFPNYMNAVFISQLYTPTIIIVATTTLLMTIARAKGMVRVQYAINILDTVFGLGITIVLIYFFGLYGLVTGIFLMKVSELAVLLWTLFYQKSS